MTASYDQRRTAYHEAGHLVVAAHQGFATYDITLDDRTNGKAATSILLSGASALDYASARVRVLLAGAVAQCRLLHSGDREFVKKALGERGNANQDFQLLEELARVLAQARLPSAASERAFADEIDKVIDEHAVEVEGILDRNDAVLQHIGRLTIDKFIEMDTDEDADPVVKAATIKPILSGLVP